ncbi:EAL domain-containing protein [Clostridium paraputrificum]|uniref:putative bifunctional diguanylate cyclase/phosphodiesterase n=1 Tax=Clostridium TaxID=1485 RepID=UPI003D34FC9A
MILLGRICKTFMILLGLLAGILLINKSEYSTIASVCLVINGIVCGFMMRNGIKALNDRNYIRYKLALEALNGAVWEWDSQERLFIISSRLREILKTNIVIDSFEKFYTFISEEDRGYIRGFFNDMIEESIEEEFTLEFTVFDNSGKAILMECSGKGEMKNSTYYLTGILLDTTEKRKQDQLLRLSEKNYRRALEGSQDIMFYFNIETSEITLSGRIAYLLELDHKLEYKLNSEDWIKYIIPSDRELYRDAYRKFIKNNSEYISLQYRIKTTSGKIVWLMERGKRIVEEDGIYIYGSMSNITDNKEKEMKIYYMGHFDDVTGTPNRRYFTDKAKRMLLKAKEGDNDFAILFMDLDNFKYVNDTYGHDAGDELLKIFCMKLNSILTKKCTLARFGGDEFIIAIEDVIHKGEVIKVLEDIIETFNIPLEVKGKEIYCTVSIGVSMYRSDGNTIFSLLKKADIAMYEAKASGKNQYYIYNPNIAEKFSRDLILKAALRKVPDNKEIYFEYQPKYWSRSNRIQGFECLARWNSKELGQISPGEFIPLAESTGLIVPIGNYLIEDAFKKCIEIMNITDVEFKMAINLSQVQIRDKQLVPFIKEKIKEYKINPSYIEFEVTESVIMKSPESSIRTLKSLKELGVSIALDDFGTGYSSLNYLKILPIDTVKIDKSFVDDIGIDNKNEFIIQKIIELAHLLELDVVAEGVEDLDQYNYLINYNCDIIQGYYFSKPKSFESVLNLVEKEKALLLK